MHRSGVCAIRHGRSWPSADAHRSAPEIMKLRPGITGLFESRECASLPEYPIADFKQLVHAVAMSQGWTVASVAEAGITPNFHAAELQSPNACIFVLGHAKFPIVAFAERMDDADQRLQFVDNSNIAGEISRLYPDVEVGSATDLNRLITDDDLAQLAHADRQQVNYWKPRTIGQLAFNWWD